jgi:hypothetical protein
LYLVLEGDGNGDECALNGTVGITIIRVVSYAVKNDFLPPPARIIWLMPAWASKDQASESFWHADSGI